MYAPRTWKVKAPSAMKTSQTKRNKCLSKKEKLLLLHFGIWRAHFEISKIHFKISKTHLKIRQAACKIWETLFKKKCSKKKHFLKYNKRSFCKKNSSQASNRHLLLFEKDSILTKWQTNVSPTIKNSSIKSAPLFLHTKN